MSEFEKYLCPQCGTMQESLKAELARLREQAIDYENDIFLGQPIEYWIRVKAQLDADMSDQYTREILLLKIELARRDETIRRLKEDAERLIWRNPNSTICICGYPDFRDAHAADCPITLHRALMKELE